MLQHSPQIFFGGDKLSKGIKQIASKVPKETLSQLSQLKDYYNKRSFTSVSNSLIIRMAIQFLFDSIFTNDHKK
jgi:hypothetical protein